MPYFEQHVRVGKNKAGKGRRYGYGGEAKECHNYEKKA